MSKHLNSTTLTITALLAFNLLVNFRILQSGYFNDDIINSQVPGIVPYIFDTIFDLTKFYFLEWVNNQGRFFPLGWYGYYVFGYLDTLLAYKAFCLSSIIFSIFLFGYFVYELCQSKKLAYLVILISPVLFQYRFYFDPFLSWGSFMQIMLVYTCISLICLIKYARTKKTGFLIVSLLFYIFSLLTYEIAYSFFLFHIIIISYTNRKTASDSTTSIMAAVPFVVVAFVCAGISLYLRSQATGIANSYTINWNLFSILKTFGYQISAALPLVYNYTGRTIFQFSSLNFIISDWKNLILIISLPLLLIYILRFEKSRLHGQKNKNLLLATIVGFLFICLPASLIALSPKIQGQLAFGVGYIPVYIQYFGTSLVLAIIVGTTHRKWLKSFLLMFIMITALHHSQSNSAVVDAVNKTYQYPRELLETFLKDSEFKAVQDHSTIIFNKPNHLHNKAFLNMHTGKKLNVEIGNGRILDPSTNSGQYYVQTQYNYPDAIVQFSRHSDLRDQSNLLETVQTRYKHIDVWKRNKEGKDLILPRFSDGRVTIYHAGGEYLPFPVRSNRKTFSIELLVKPEPRNGLYAHIIGNHPGSQDYAGFVFHLYDPEKSIYAFKVGNRKRWSKRICTSIIPEQWNYLVINLMRNKTTIFHNGNEVASEHFNIEINDGDYLVSVGDWFFKDRGFKGDIAEVRISSQGLGRFAIQRNWELVQQKQIPPDKKMDKVIHDDAMSIKGRCQIDNEEVFYFARIGLPGFVDTIKGLSGREAWGRWSDANDNESVKIAFKSPFPKNFFLILKAWAFGPNVGREILFKVGSNTKTLVLTEAMTEYRLLFEDVDPGSHVLEITPPTPKSPRDLGISNDTRKLGIGFERLSIRKRM
jgi:hypothetical protein